MSADHIYLSDIGFLSLGTVDICGQIILCWPEGKAVLCLVGCLGHLWPSPLLPIMNTKNVSKHRHMSPREGGQNCPQLDATDLTQIHGGTKMFSTPHFLGYSKRFA